MKSRTCDADSADGIDVPPELLPRIDWLLIDGNCASDRLPEMSVKAGCEVLGTPSVEIELIQRLAVDVRLWIQPSDAGPGFGH